jgi:hypothetical protein
MKAKTPRKPKTQVIVHNPSKPLTQFESMLSFIERAAKDESVDVAKFQGLLDIQERIMNKNAEIAYNQAMTRLQRKLPLIHKKGMIEFIDKNGVKRLTPFAKYEDIDRAIRPLYLEEGFHVGFDTKQDDKVFLRCSISHETGHSKSAEMKLPLDTSGSKNNLQAAGSTISYGKRYLVCMLLNIVTTDEDDDAKTHQDEKPKDVFHESVQAEEAWDCKTFISAGGEAYLIPVGTGLSAAVGLFIEHLKKIGSFETRLAIVNNNNAFIRALGKAGLKDEIALIHQAVDGSDISRHEAYGTVK